MTTTIMLKLGNLKFSIDTAAYNTLQRSWNYNWQAQSRIGNIPALHYTGRGEDTITLPGTIYPGQSGTKDYIEQIAAEAVKGKPLLLVSGMGDVMGYWVIKSVQKTSSNFFSDGQGRKIAFNVQLSYYGEDYAI